jgi:hypothetical protein
MRIEAKVIEIIYEDATATVSNTGGMGPVTPAQPSTNSGSTIGADFSGGGGTVGSGDVSNRLGTYQKSPTKKGKNKKKVFQLKQNWTKGSDKTPRKIESWDKFSINKVTHLNGE